MRRGRPSKKMSSDPTFLRLRDFGITRDQSSQWQKLAEIPEDVFEALLQPDLPAANHRGMPSTTGMLRSYFEPGLAATPEERRKLAERLRLAGHELLRKAAMIEAELLERT